MDFSHLGFVPKFFVPEKIGTAFLAQICANIIFFEKNGTNHLCQSELPDFFVATFFVAKKIATNFSATVLWQV